MKILYCWRCKMDLPMLDETEWEAIGPLLRNDTLSTSTHSEAEGAWLDSMRQMRGRALDEYERITGFRETNSNALWHHRVSLYGPPCHACGKPLRTPEARVCGACMAPRRAV